MTDAQHSPTPLLNDEEIKRIKGMANYDYGIGYFIPEPPKTVTGYKLTATLPTIGEFSKTYKEKYEADNAKSMLQDAVRIGSDNVPVSVEKIEVPEDDLPF